MSREHLVLLWTIIGAVQFLWLWISDRSQKDRDPMPTGSVILMLVLCLLVWPINMGWFIYKKIREDIRKLY